MSRKRKPFTSYLDDAPAWWIDAFELYQRSPATAFLSETVHLSDAINHCVRSFKKRQDGNYTKDSQDSIHRLSAAALAAIMGHFEMFQRFLFAGSLEATRLIPAFNIAQCCSKLEKSSGLSIDVGRLAGYRGRPAPIGQVIADNLPDWHQPDRVNAHFRTVVPEVNLYSNDNCEELRVLWQLRHSIVHTAGWLTDPDAQKVRELGAFGGKPIVLGDEFVPAAARRLHLIVVPATDRLGAKLTDLLPEDLEQDEQNEVEELFKVETPRRSWLPEGRA